MPSKSLVKKCERCQGGKKAIDRLTVLVCCSLIGVKLRPVIIGRAEYPQAFPGKKN